ELQRSGQEFWLVRRDECQGTPNRRHLFLHRFPQFHVHLLLERRDYHLHSTSPCWPTATRPQVRHDPLHGGLELEVLRLIAGWISFFDPQFLLRSTGGREPSYPGEIWLGLAPPLQ